MEDVIVPALANVPQPLRERWLAHPNAYFFRYDQQYRWRDGSQEFRTAVPVGQCAAPGGPVPVRIAAGGGRITDRAGRVWKADTNYDAGGTYSAEGVIEGTDMPELYRSERFHEAPFQYRFCVPEGTYRVTLKFAEIWFTRPGQRVFHVALNGAKVLENFDVAAAAGGPRRAIDKDFRVAAVGNQIRIEFQPVVSNPKINAIEITPF